MSTGAWLPNGARGRDQARHWRGATLRRWRRRLRPAPRRSRVSPRVAEPSSGRTGMRWSARRRVAARCDPAGHSAESHGCVLRSHGTNVYFATVGPYVYGTSRTGLLQQSLAGGAPLVLDGSAVLSPGAIAVDEAWVYYPGHDTGACDPCADGSVLKVPIRRRSSRHRGDNAAHGISPDRRGRDEPLLRYRHRRLQGHAQVTLRPASPRPPPSLYPQV